MSPPFVVMTPANGTDLMTTLYYLILPNIYIAQVGIL
jgi:hypothetical protein